MEQLQKIDRFVIGLIILILVLTVGIALWSPDFFALSFAAEDGIVEYGTAVALLVTSILFLRHGFAMKGRRPALAVGFTFVYALLFFFGAGEEISWGQRIFGWETSEAMKELNRQDETNLHNLEFGGVALTKHLFGPVLTLCILLYLLALPFIYNRSSTVSHMGSWIVSFLPSAGPFHAFAAWVRRMADKIAVPVPGSRHAFFALLGSLIITVIDVERKWEAYECIFGLLMVSILILPKNRDKIT